MDTRLKNLPEFSIKNRLKEHCERFDTIMTRGSEKGIKKVSEEMLLVSAEVVARIMAYTKAAGLTDDLHKAGAPVDHIPQEIEDQMDKALNKLDDLVTLESSAIGQV